MGVEEKAALLAEIEAEGGRVKVVARRHQVSESLLYNWRSAWKAAASARPSGPVEFLRLGVIGERETHVPLLPARNRRRGSRGNRAGGIEIACRAVRECRCARQREGTVECAAGAEGVSMISLAPGTKVFLACRPIDLRNGFNGLAAKVKQMIGRSFQRQSFYVPRQTR